MGSEMLRCAQHDRTAFSMTGFRQHDRTALSMTVLFYCCAMGLAVNMVSRAGITWRFEK